MRLALLALLLPAVLHSQQPDSVRSDSVSVPAYRVVTRSYYTRSVRDTLWKHDTVTVHDTVRVRDSVVTPPPKPCTGVQVASGAAVQPLVDANPGRTTFCIPAGTYRRQTITPKDGDTFQCAPGARFDGENTNQFGVKSTNGNPDHVSVIGCTFIRYVPPVQQAVIQGGWGDPGTQTTGWWVLNNTIDSSANLSIRLGDSMIVKGNRVLRCGTLCIGGSGRGILVDSNEVGWANYQRKGQLGFEAGASKFVRTLDAVIRNNWFHDAVGPCIWLDIGNDRTLIEGNVVERCLQEGIVSEISYAVTIRGNTVRAAGLGDTRNTAWTWGAGIAMESSGGTGSVITGNRLEGNAHGVAIMQQNRGSANGDPPPLAGGSYSPPYLAQNVLVTGNTVTCGSGSLSVAAMVDDAGGTAVSTARNNRFTGNTYVLSGCPANAFSRNTGWTTEAAWKAAGQQ